MTEVNPRTLCGDCGTESPQVDGKCANCEHRRGIAFAKAGAAVRKKKKHAATAKKRAAIKEKNNPPAVREAKEREIALSEQG
ncbi:MAG: hypothetical protein E4H01_13440, partial [Lysobacterales bacterium]